MGPGNFIVKRKTPIQNSVKYIFIPEGDGVVEDEWEGRCLPCCLEAILDSAAQ